MFQPPNSTFEVERPVIQPSFTISDEAKRSFGRALNTHKTSFEAACSVFWDTGQAMWASQFLVNDPVVLAAKDVADKTQESPKLLDKAALASKVLDFADEKDPSGRFYLVESKDRLAALKLYAEIQGFVGKNEFNPVINNTNNVMQIKLVKPEPKEENIIDHTSASLEMVEQLDVPKIRLVSAG